MTYIIPFNDHTKYQISYSVAIKNIRPGFSNIKIANCFRKLIENCWKINPDERPSFDQILNELKSNKDFKDIGKQEYQDYINFIDKK